MERPVSRRRLTCPQQGVISGMPAGSLGETLKTLRWFQRPPATHPFTGYFRGTAIPADGWRSVPAPSCRHLAAGIALRKKNSFKESVVRRRENFGPVVARTLKPNHSYLRGGCRRTIGKFWSCITLSAVAPTALNNSCGRIGHREISRCGSPTPCSTRAAVPKIFGMSLPSG